MRDEHFVGRIARAVLLRPVLVRAKLCSADGYDDLRFLRCLTQKHMHSNHQLDVGSMFPRFYIDWDDSAVLCICAAVAFKVSFAVHGQYDWP